MNNCLFCTSGCEVCQKIEVVSDLPDWFAGSSSASSEQKRRAEAGQHPNGGGLADEGACGACVHFSLEKLDKTYRKCGLWRLSCHESWKACDRYEEIG